MGQEAACTARFDGQASEGKALLETDALIFRGRFRLSIPIPSISAVSAAEGALSVSFGQGTATFELGPKADRWANAILHPRGRLDKLGVKPGSRVKVIDIDDPEFLSELERRGVDLVNDSAPTEADAIFFGVIHRDQLNRLTSLRDQIVPAGAIWVVSRRRDPDISERDVMEGARAHGLVDTKVVRFSDTYTSAKLVIPVAERKKR